MKILAIETSCDETAASVVEDGTKIISNVVASSTVMHKKYGGIVPEIAAREQLKCIIPVITEALSVYSSSEARSLKKSSRLIDSNNIRTAIENHIDSIAVTVGPGLIGSLLIGVESAKTIAFVTGKPIVPVNHVLAHMYANFVTSDQPSATSQQTEEKNSLKAESRKLIAFPAISLVVSGGHTDLYLMKSKKNLIWLGGTLDDAAGEAFDKTARLLGFGTRGGVAIQEEARGFKIQDSRFKINLPRPMIHDESLNFSFSGLKTAIVREWTKYVANQKPRPMNQELIYAFANEVQEAITDVLVVKTLKALEIYKAKSVLLSGGVAANLRLREKFLSKLEALSPASPAGGSKLSLHVPPVELCTDNAVYIGSYAHFRGKPEPWKNIEAVPDLSVEV